MCYKNGDGNDNEEEEVQLDSDGHPIVCDFM